MRNEKEQIICPICKSNLSDSDNICPKCGAEFYEETKETKHKVDPRDLEDTEDLEPLPPINVIGLILKWMGILFIAIGFILTISAFSEYKDYLSDSTKTVIGIKIGVYLASGIISGTIFLGFSEIIKLLHKLTIKAEK